MTSAPRRPAPWPGARRLAPAPAAGLLFSILPAPVLAQDIAAGPDLGRALGALVIVLVLLFACAWVARRSGFARRVSGTLPVKVLGSMNVGPRERILVLEVDGTWLVVGATPGGMQTLHTLPAQPGALPPAAPDWRASLARAVRRRHGDDGAGDRA